MCHDVNLLFLDFFNILHPHPRSYISIHPFLTFFLNPSFFSNLLFHLLHHLFSHSLTTDGTCAINPLLPGIRVYALFGFCDIQDFEFLTQQLGYVTILRRLLLLSSSIKFLLSCFNISLVDISEIFGSMTVIPIMISPSSVIWFVNLNFWVFWQFLNAGMKYWFLWIKLRK